MQNIKFDDAFGVEFEIGVEVTVPGYLVVSDGVIYLAKYEDEQDKKILVLAPWLIDVMLDKFPVNVGSKFLFGGSAAVTGQLSQSGNELMPTALCEISKVEFEGHELLAPTAVANVDAQTLVRQEDNEDPKKSLLPSTPVKHLDSANTKRASPQVPVKCLAHATFKSDSTGSIYGELWLLSTDQDLVDSFGTDVALPTVFSAQGFNASLGIITANGFGDCFFLEGRQDLEKLLIAIKAEDVASLYSINTDYVPFYCPKCRVCYEYSQWFTGPIYDDGFYDYLEATCPNGHRLKILD